MDRLFQQSLSGRPGQLLSGMRSEAIPLDVVERDDAYEVHAAVPGVRPEDVEVVVQGERVTIRAEHRADEERRDENWLMREHRYGALQRSITLPTPVRSDNAEARIEHGILVLRLPKAQEARPRRINIGTSGASGTGSTSSASSTGSSSSAPSGEAPPGSQQPAQSDAAGGGHGHGSRDATAGGDRVTAESQESFPASDPPSWTPEKVG
jgi:HSP20 family protein